MSLEWLIHTNTLLKEKFDALFEQLTSIREDHSIATKKLQNANQVIESLREQIQRNEQKIHPLKETVEDGATLKGRPFPNLAVWS